MSKATVYEIVTDRIVKQLEAGVVPWRKPWKNVGGLGAVGFNLSSGRSYRGINTLLTMGFDVPAFLTFKQITELGGLVKKGETGTIVVYWMEYKDQKDEAKKFFAPRYYRVFNISQIEDHEGKIAALLEKRLGTAKDLPEFTPIERAEKVIAAMPNRPALMNNGGDRAFYMPAFDSVHMPPKEAFPNNEEYYATLFHELAHSTGHKKRIGRDGILEPHRFGDAIYAKEELVAEITAAFVCGACEFDRSVEPTAAYIQSWLKALKNDPKMVMQAAQQAQRAADYIQGIKAEVEETESEQTEKVG